MRTRLTVWVCLLAVAGLFVAPQLRAQDLPGATDSTNPTSVSDRSAAAAVVLEWALPTVGYAYAGNWSRGIPPAVVRLLGFAMVLDHQFTIFGSPPPCEGQCAFGYGIAAAGTVWAMFDVARTTTRENARRRAAAVEVSVAPSSGRNGLGVGLRVTMRR